jgi:hypothetical protein
MEYLLSRAAGQFERAGMDGMPYALRINVIERMAENLGFVLDRSFYDKLDIWEREALRIMLAKAGITGNETDEQYLESMMRAQKRLNGTAK